MGRHRRTYSQGGDSDWAALRALRAVEAPPGSWAKIARTHESGISFGRGIYLSYDLVMTTTQMSSSSIIPPLNHALGIIHSYSESRTRLRTTKRGSNTKEFGNQ